MSTIAITGKKDSLLQQKRPIASLSRKSYKKPKTPKTVANDGIINLSEYDDTNTAKHKKPKIKSSSSKKPKEPKPKQPKVAPDSFPVEVVSTMYVLEKTTNFAEIVGDCWPNLHMYLPFYENGCVVCDSIYKQFFDRWYSNKENKDDLIHLIDINELASMDEKWLEKENEVSLEKHRHAIVINEEFVLKLPEKPRVVVKQTKKLDETAVENEKNADAATTIVETKLKPKKVEKLDSWWVRTLKELKDNFYVEHTNGHVSAWGGFQKFTPWDYQERAQQWFAQEFDWSRTNQRYGAFFVYLPMGLGKTNTVYHAMQQNPASEVDIICDISIIEQRWMEELFKFFPPKKGTTVYRIFGYDEFRARIRAGEFKNSHERVRFVDECQEYRTLTPGMMVDLAEFRKSLAVFGLSGTILMNDLDDLYGANRFMEISPLETMAEIKVKEEYYRKHSNNTKSSKNHNNNNENPFHYMTSSNSKSFYRWMYDSYKGKVFYYELNNPLKTIDEIVRIPMTWRQSFEYLMSGHQDIKFKHLTLSSGVRNSFDTMLRRVSNFLIDNNTEQILDAPKATWLLEYIKSNWEDPEKRHKTFPIVIFSKFKKRGVIGFSKMLQEMKLEGLRSVVMTGDTNANDRAKYCDEFSAGQIPVFMICRIGRRGLDLLGAKTMVLFEVLDSDGEKRQTIARALRAGNKAAREADPIMIKELISTFPTSAPNAHDKKQLLQSLAQKAKLSVEALQDELPDAVDLIENKIKSLKQTVDEKCFQRNPQKSRELERPDLIIKAASIEFKDIPSKFNDLLQKLI